LLEILQPHLAAVEVMVVEQQEAMVQAVEDLTEIQVVKELQVKEIMVALELTLALAVAVEKMPLVVLVVPLLVVLVVLV
jgi:hypothetical protein